MASIAKILRSKRGTSIILVGCVALILFFIGGSVVFAASNTSGAQLKRQETAICATFAKDFARELTAMILDESYTKTSGETPWKAIAEGAYDENQSGGSALVDLRHANVSLQPSDGTDALWLFEDDSVKISFATTKVDVTITRPYVAPVPPVYDDEDGDGVDELIAPGVSEVLEQAEIYITLTADITVSRGEASYLLRANYAFSGTTEGEPGGAPGSGSINSGGWILLGYEQQ